MNDTDFKTEILSSNLPVLVDFFATWCVPCKSISPIIDSINDEYKIKVVKIDIDENIEITKQCGVKGVPTLIIFKDGVEYKRIVGLKLKREIDSILKEIL
jgi:thioredoxin 1